MTHAIEIRGLRKTYGSMVALNGLDLSVPTGSVFGLLGPNGAGKSTTFGMLCGWLQPTSGTATVLGTPCNQLHRLNGRVTALPQDAQFPRSMPIRHQLAHFARMRGMSGSAARTEADRVLAIVGLQDARSKRGNQLSHGMAKRAGIAQALVGKPEVVFLDEPTAGLDPKNAHTIRDIIQRLAPAATVVVSSHNLAEIQSICTHGAILDHGHLTASGRIGDLTAQGELLVIVSRPGANVPVAALEQTFGAGTIAVSPDMHIEVRFPAGRDPAEVTAAALGVLLQAGVPILEVRQGTSLEDAFLKLTEAPASGAP